MSDNKTAFDIKDFRQPMIASLGIIMGFLLNFLATWAVGEDDAAIQTAADWVVALTLIAALVLMFAVLYGLLAPAPQNTNPERRYVRIFRAYLLSLLTAFAGVMLALFL